MTPDFPYDTNILARVMNHANRHAMLCQKEIVTLRTQLAELRAENQKLKTNLESVSALIYAKTR